MEYFEQAFGDGMAALLLCKDSASAEHTEDLFAEGTADILVAFHNGDLYSLEAFVFEEGNTAVGDSFDCPVGGMAERSVATKSTCLQCRFPKAILIWVYYLLSWRGALLLQLSQRESTLSVIPTASGIVLSC